jgi:uncharacterized protein (DUF2267 family)
MEADPLALIADVIAGRADAWPKLVEHLFPQLEAIVGRSRHMGPLRGSLDHRRNATTHVLDKLSRNECNALKLLGEWLEANPLKTFDDWLRIVVANGIRDYVTSQLGSPVPEGAVNKRMLHTLAQALPDDDQGRGARPAVTDQQTARAILEYAEEHLSDEQMRALAAWLHLGDFAAVSAAAGIPDAAAAEKLVRSALAKLRRQFADGEA